MELMTPIMPGELWWLAPDVVIGREQAGRRPVLIVSNNDFHAMATTLVMVVPVTATDRGWPNHVDLGMNSGLQRPSFAMAEQMRTVSRQRLLKRVGVVEDATLENVRKLIRRYIDAG